MNKPSFTLLVLLAALFFSSCRNQSVVLLTKKWDCVQVEYMPQPGTKWLTAKDSADAEQLKTLLQQLSWTFKNNMRYQCTVNGRITQQGKYQLLQQNQILVCTSGATNISNRYQIKTLTDNELVLAGNAENINIVLHFRPHP